jgi:hypothetical protein
LTSKQQRWQVSCGGVQMKKHLYKILNLTVFGLSISAGVSEMDPKELLHSNPDWIFCSAILLLMPVFTVGIVQYSISRSAQSFLRRPSWNRFSLSWWGDPLQCLFQTTYSTAAVVIGSATRFPSTTMTGHWMFAAWMATFLGLVAGQVIVYRLYRSRLAGPKSCFD